MSFCKVRQAVASYLGSSISHTLYKTLLLKCQPLLPHTLTHEPRSFLSVGVGTLGIFSFCCKEPEHPFSILDCKKVSSHNLGGRNSWQPGNFLRASLYLIA